MPSPDLLTVSDLEVGFATDGGIAKVLDRVNLRIGHGQVVGLVGESGCGKTTLARAILGVLPMPAARIGGGEIVFHGRDLLSQDAETVNRLIRGRKITFIPQDPYGSFNPLFTVGDQIMQLMKWNSPLIEENQDRRSMLPALFQPYPRARYRADREKVLEVLRLVQLPQPEQALKKLPHEFSGGQRQRLMIAMALLSEPDLIIADEPTTALDVTIQAQILRLLRQLVKDRGISVLFTTHDLGTAYEICDSITVMYAGQEMESASTEAFFGRPSHRYTNRLLESLPSADRDIQGIGGDVPSLVDPPGGCRFHPRCDYATEECRQVRPDTETLADDHWVRCHHPKRDWPATAEPATVRHDNAG